MSTNINVYIFILLTYILLNLKFLSNKFLNLFILGIFHDKLISQICFQTTQRRPRKIKTNFKNLKIFYFFIYLSVYLPSIVRLRPRPSPEPCRGRERPGESRYT